jgi:hypothetical protein
MHDLWAYYEHYHGVGLAKLDHVFSCENIQFKQRWITSNCRPRYLFTDFLQFGGKDRTAHELYSDTAMEPPTVHIAVIGIECDSVSTLNHKVGPKRQNNMSTHHKLISASMSMWHIIADQEITNRRTSTSRRSHRARAAQGRQREQR